MIAENLQNMIGVKFKMSRRKIIIKNNKILDNDEHSIQSACIDWCRWNEGNYPVLQWIYAIPNGGNLVKSKVWDAKKKKDIWISNSAKKLKEEGLNPGVPDLCLPTAIGKCHGLYIEVKRPGGTISKEQKEWIKYLNFSGYKAKVIYSLEEFIEVVTGYLKFFYEGINLLK